MILLPSCRTGPRQLIQYLEIFCLKPNNKTQQSMLACDKLLFSCVNNIFIYIFETILGNLCDYKFPIFILNVEYFRAPAIENIKNISKVISNAAQLLIFIFGDTYILSPIGFVKHS